MTAPGPGAIDRRFHDATAMLPAGLRHAIPEPIAPHRVQRWIRLTPVAPGPGLSLEQTIAARRTRRDFDPRASLPPELLARLLAFSAGQAWGAASRAAPSAGGVYPDTAYPIVSRVDDLAPGAYVYAADQHALGLVRPGGWGPAVAEWSLGQSWLAGAALVVAVAMSPGPLRERYRARGYRYALLEAGHIAQNLLLLSSAYGLAAQSTGGFVDEALARLLGLQGTGDRVLYLVAIGPGRGDAGGSAPR